MAQGKYAKYVNELAQNKDMPSGDGITQALESDKRYFEGATHHLESFIVYAPGFCFHGGSMTLVIDGKELRDFPIKLQYDEMTLFIGTNPQDPTDLGGEVECWLGEGEEAEKYMITKSSCIFCPAGLVHLPLCFRKVDRPIIFIVIIPSPDPPQLYWEFADKFPPGFSRDK